MCWRQAINSTRELGAFGLFVVLAVLFGCPQAGGARLLISGGAWDNPPFEFINERGEPDGFSVDLLRAIARETGNEVRFSLDPLSRATRQLLDGKIDILQSLAPTPERGKYLMFSDPIANIENAVFGKTGTRAVSALSELADKTVVVKETGYIAGILSRMTGSRLVKTYNLSHALAVLSAGAADYLVCPAQAGLHYIDQYGLDDLRIMGPPVSLAQLSYTTAAGGDPEVMRILNSGLAKVRESGEYQTISDRWLKPMDPRLPSLKTVLRRGMYVIGPLAVIVLGLLGFSHLLARRVARRTKELEQEVRLHRQAREQLEVQQEMVRRADRLASLGSMAAGVAHEINTPNGFILLNIPLLQRAFRQSRKVLDREYEANGDFRFAGQPYSKMREELPGILEDMAEGADKIRSIVRDLKEFAHAGAEESKEELDLNETVRSTLRVVRGTLRRSTRDCRVELADHLPTVRGTRGKLQQVLTNLLLNACEALEDPSQSVTVRTATSADGCCVLLEVRDQGRGIAPEHLDRITSPFFTTKRAQGGTGLGLSVSSGIVEEHGGRLEFVSRPGRGTTARLLLPASGAPETRSG